MSRVDTSLVGANAPGYVTMSTTCIPPYEEWTALLESNLAAEPTLHARIGLSVVQKVRTEVLQAAQDYTSELYAIAQRVGITLPERAAIHVDATRPVIMAGHQPVMYHPGLLEKTNRLAEFSRATGALAINVSIDTDEGDGGHVMWPLIQQNDLVLKHGSVGTVGTLFKEQRVKSPSEVSSLFEQLRADLISSGLEEVGKRTARVSRLYQVLSNESIVVANAIVRCAESGAGYLEVPLSQLVGLPSVRCFIQAIVQDGARFASIYNATLDEYRRSHKIKNPANPFPNMAIGDDSIELPLWRVKGDSRVPLRVDVLNAQDEQRDEIIAPRGSIVTLFLRGVCSDLFVHGLGGGKYDQFVDSFALALWGTPLPRFVVASATRYLFPEHLERFNRARDLRSQYKKMVSHTEMFLGVGIFSSSEDAALGEKVAQRQLLLKELREVNAPEKRSEVSHALNAINRSIRELIDTSSITPTLIEDAIDDVRLARWACREFPFFFFQ